MHHVRYSSRLTLHPYAAFPGPFLAKITNFYSLYYAWLQESHTDILRCHEKYGDVVRYGPNKLLFNNSRALQGRLWD
ncbi:MAG: hypothetical protein Q9194_005592 [Teloschistes cf. exilis]